MHEHVRRIQPEDADRLKAVRLQALAESPEAFASSLREERALPDRHWREIAVSNARGQASIGFIALDGEAIVGLVAGLLEPDVHGAAERGARLVSMWVDPAYRRRGLGRRLAGAVCDWANAIGADRLSLWVARGNAPAVALYRRMGFEPTGRQQRLRGPAGLLEDEMMLPLGKATGETVG